MGAEERRSTRRRYASTSAALELKLTIRTSAASGRGEPAAFRAALQHRVRHVRVASHTEHPAGLMTHGANSSAQSVMPAHPGASKNFFGGTYSVLA